MRVSNAFLCITASVCVLSLSVASCYNMYFSFNALDIIATKPKSWLQWLLFVGSKQWYLVDPMVRIAVVSQFCRKLLQLIESMESRGNSLSVDEDGFNALQQPFVALVTKHTLLVALMVVLNPLYGVAVTFRAYHPPWLSTFFFISLNTLFFMESVCLYLSFQFAEKTYGRCCGCCDGLLSMCCRRCAKSHKREQTQRTRTRSRLRSSLSVNATTASSSDNVGLSVKKLFMYDALANGDTMQLMQDGSGRRVHSARVRTEPPELAVVRQEEEVY